MVTSERDCVEENGEKEEGRRVDDVIGVRERLRRRKRGKEERLHVPYEPFVKAVGEGAAFPRPPMHHGVISRDVRVGAGGFRGAVGGEDGGRGLVSCCCCCLVGCVVVVVVSCIIVVVVVKKRGLSFYCCVAVVVIVVVAVVVVMVVVCRLDLVFDAADFALDIGEWESEIRALFRGKRNGGGKRDS